MDFKFKSLFRAEKTINYDAFPKPPNRREIIEDIEHLTEDDPVIAFAELLYSKGKLKLYTRHTYMGLGLSLR